MKKVRLAALFSVLLLCRYFDDPGVLNASAQGAQQIGVLVAGAPVERELAGEETHAYFIPLAAGQYLRVTIAQRSLDVVARLFSPDGRQLDEVNNPNETREPEQLFLVAESSGPHRLEVRAARKDAARGKYEIRVEELRPATPQDVSRAAAERLFAEGKRLHSKELAESRREAIRKYEEAIALFRSAAERARESAALNNLGYVYGLLGERQKSLENYAQSLRLSRETGDRKLEATALLNIGFAYREMGENQPALDHYHQALVAARAAGDPDREAGALNNIGAIHILAGEPHQALEHFSRSLEAFRAMGNRRAESTLLNNLGFINSTLGENRKALEHYVEARRISQSLGDRGGEADTNVNLGTIHQRMGESQKALECFTQALALFQAAGNRQREAMALNSLGFFHYSLGEPQNALQYYRRSLELSRAAGDRSGAADALNNIGLVHLAASEYPAAIEHFLQALELKRAVGDRRGETNTLINLGVAHEKSGQYGKALEYHNQSLAISRSLGNRSGEAYALHNAAAAYHLLGETGKALEHYRQALGLRRAAEEPMNVAETLFRMARIESERGETSAAKARVEEAIEIIESLRTRVAGPELRASYFAPRRAYYELQIALLMRQHKLRPAEGHDRAALETSERSRARALLDTLAEARVDIRQGVDESLLARERNLQQRINSKEQARLRLRAAKAGEKQIETIANELNALLTEYQEARARTRAASPRYAALTEPQPLSVAEIRRQALDGDTLLLEYSLGEERSFLWAVTKTEFESHELPNRAEIEAAARQVYELLTARNQRVSGETTIQRRSRIAKADADFPRAATALSRMLLAPVAPKLKSQRLVIVSDGALQYIPFHALPAPVVDGGSARRLPANFQPLIAGREVVSLPSASVIFALRQDAADRRRAGKLIAVLADPVFEKDDPRVIPEAGDQLTRDARPASSSEPAGLKAEVERAASETGVDRFLRLRFTRQEAEAITALAPAARRMSALDFTASRATLDDPDLANYRILHFATHGLVNSRHPELSGVVLSLVDEQGQPQDGFLRLHEIYNLKLNAETVVLSGCRTALGQEIKGEGLVGLTRGFMYAGAKRVMASLWSVEDRATAELMKRFYAGMLGQNQPAATALRAAQLQMSKDKRWTAPYYWAAFTLQGEWK